MERIIVIISKIILGIIFAFLIWKLLKVTLKVGLWLFLIGAVVALVIPSHLFLVSGLGLLILTVLVSLLILGLISFIFFESI